MPTFKIAIIDGTGDFSNESYDRSMAHSFCRQISDRLGGPNGARAHYRRGPSVEGAKTGQKGREAADILRTAQTADRQVRLFLAGYSRGASAAIIAAEALQAQGVFVQAMFLFDPVARHMSDGGEVIPANVGRAYVASRALDSDIVARYEGSLSARGEPRPDKIGAFSVWKAATLLNPVGAAVTYATTGNPIRPWFGKTATSMTGPSMAPDGRPRLLSKIFRGSHGALGGVGWKMVEEDLGCQKAVAAFMNDALSKEGLGVQLASFAPIV